MTKLRNILSGIYVRKRIRKSIALYGVYSIITFIKSFMMGIFIIVLTGLLLASTCLIFGVEDTLINEMLRPYSLMIFIIIFFFYICKMMIEGIKEDKLVDMTSINTFMFASGSLTSAFGVGSNLHFSDIAKITFNHLFVYLIVFCIITFLGYKIKTIISDKETKERESIDFRNTMKTRNNVNDYVCLFYHDNEGEEKVIKGLIGAFESSELMIHLDHGNDTFIPYEKIVTVYSPNHIKRVFEKENAIQSFIKANIVLIDEKYDLNVMDIEITNISGDGIETNRNEFIKYSQILVVRIETELYKMNAETLKFEKDNTYITRLNRI